MYVILLCFYSSLSPTVPTPLPVSQSLFSPQEYYYVVLAGSEFTEVHQPLPDECWLEGVCHHSQLKFTLDIADSSKKL